MNFFQKIEDKSEWEGVLNRVLFKTFFHMPAWENFLEKEFSWVKFEHYVWREQLGVSMASCKVFGKEKLISHPFCEYGGPLPLRREIDFQNFYTDFYDFFGENAYMQIHPYILKFCAPKIIYAFVSGEESESKRATFWIENLEAGSGKLWAAFRGDYRARVRKAERMGVTVEECKTKKDLERFYTIYVETMKRHQNIPLPFGVFEFLNGGRARIFLAKVGEKVMGGSAFLFYKPFIHYFINASDRNFRTYGVNHAILWHAIQKFAGGEYAYLDLGGTRKGSNLEEFKRGARPKEYPIVTIGERGSRVRDRKFLRLMWSLVPNGAMKLLSPYLLRFKI
ncbi:MAG: GNAT family N-acetyltransferase [Candidatus Spechtbacteria bacterium]|nr:GNAT family N-acetyltransferase [Candidatus Spechtbacteria bacterium]